MMTSCEQLAQIIGGTAQNVNGVCIVTRPRFMNAMILGRKTNSPLALQFSLSFENNFGGESLNLGETVLLEDEVDTFLSALRKRDLNVTSVQNRWQSETPRLVYVNWQNIGDQVEFAEDSYKAAKKAGLF